MPSTKELWGWLFLSFVLLGVLLAWSLVAPCSQAWCSVG
jgi:hypothetical protein